jgi:hypothetical protein
VGGRGRAGGSGGGTNSKFSRIDPVRRVSKTLAGALVVFLLAVGLAACGGGSSNDTSSIGPEATAPSGGESTAAQAPAAKESEEGAGKEEAQGEEPASRKKEAAEFVPKHHNDSGGGSSQFIVKGADNSVQEFGEEADSGEFDAAATALHNFLDARTGGNWAAACDYMAKSVIESFEKLVAQAKQIEDKSCAGILEKLTNPAAAGAMKEEADQANVGSLRVEGERSFVIYKGPHGAILSMPMTKENGEWKVNSLAGTPLN